MGTNCATLVADLLLFYYERDFKLSLSGNNPPDVAEALNSTLKYLDGLLNIDNPYFAQMVSQIYPNKLHGIQEVTSECQLILNDRAVTSKV